MRFAMEMKDRLCPPHLGKDRCLVFELLKGHFCLQDSAMGVGSTTGNRFYRGMYRF